MLLGRFISRVGIPLLLFGKFRCRLSHFLLFCCFFVAWVILVHLSQLCKYLLLLLVIFDLLLSLSVGFPFADRLHLLHQLILILVLLCLFLVELFLGYIGKHVWRAHVHQFIACWTVISWTLSSCIIGTALPTLLTIVTNLDTTVLPWLSCKRSVLSQNLTCLITYWSSTANLVSKLVTGAKYLEFFSIFFYLLLSYELFSLLLLGHLLQQCIFVVLSCPFLLRKLKLH
jgi:hypothetical protein